MFENVPTGKRSTVAAFCFGYVLFLWCEYALIFLFSVLSWAPAGTGSSGAAAGQTGAEGGVDPQWHCGQPEGDPAESTVQPHPDPTAFHQTAAEPGEKEEGSYSQFVFSKKIVQFKMISLKSVSKSLYHTDTVLTAALVFCSVIMALLDFALLL